MPTAITLEQHRMMLILVTCITFAPCLLLISIVEIVQKIGVNLNHCICSLSGRNGHIMREGINATWVEHASGERYSFWAGSIRARLHLNVDKKKKQYWRNPVKRIIVTVLLPLVKCYRYSSDRADGRLVRENPAGVSHRGRSDR